MSGSEDSYLLDTNVFIEAYNRYYAFDLAPAFWVKLASMAREDRVKSIDYVYNEINRGDNDLTAWTNDKFKRWFESTERDDVVEIYRLIIHWSQTGYYTTDAKDDFIRTDNADAWMVAYAKANNLVIVTQERFNARIKRRIPIPNACEEFGVRYINTFAMMRKLGIILG